MNRSLMVGPSVEFQIKISRHVQRALLCSVLNPKNLPHKHTTQSPTFELTMAVVPPTTICSSICSHSTPSLPFSSLNHHPSSLIPFTFPSTRISTFSPRYSSPRLPITLISCINVPRIQPHSSPAGGGGDIDGGNRGKDGGGRGGDGDDAEDKNREDAFLVLSQMGRSVESLPKDLSAAVEAGRIPGTIIRRYLDLETSKVMGWLLQFGGFKERLLADDLFLAKVAMECGVGIFTKTAAELDRRRENFTKELDFVIADVLMAIIADFMLVWLPAPTVSLRPAIAISAGPVAKFFHKCPDNAFQVALSGTSYSLLQRIGAIMRNGAKLFAVGTFSSLIVTGVTNGLINARKAVDKSFAGEAEDVPVFSTSVAYGVYMAVSSNLRYQVLAGVIEQRMLEPLLHKHKIILSAVCFAIRTGNTYLGSLLWVDYARWVGVQKIRE